MDLVLEHLQKLLDDGVPVTEIAHVSKLHPQTIYKYCDAKRRSKVSRGSVGKLRVAVTSLVKSKVSA